MEEKIPSVVNPDPSKKISSVEDNGNANNGEYMCNFLSESEIRILVVDGNEKGIKLAKENLTKLGALLVNGALTGNEALDEVKAQKYDVIVSEYDLPDMSGIDLHKKLILQNFTIPFILFTSPGGTDIIKEAIKSSSDFLFQRSGNPVLVYSDLCQKIRQITQLHQAENKLKLYTEELEETVKERTRELEQVHRFSVIGELATMIGHDMRNPLQVITNMEFLAKRRRTQMNSAEYDVLERFGINTILSKIEDETIYLNKIVSDLQDYARDISLNLSLVDVRQLFLDFQLLLKINEKITYNVKVPMGIMISADKELIKRVFSNLITNSISSMTEGGILQVNARTEGENTIIELTDTGKGITEDIFLKIFDPLFTTKPKGTGFGLPVAKRLIEAHNGTIQLESHIGKGTTVTIKLPNNSAKQKISLK